jgi:hypothetical protein
MAEHFVRENPRKFRLISNSVGKSGTTWMREMLSSLPGYRRFPMEQHGFTGGSPGELAAVEPGFVYHGHLEYSEQVHAKLVELGFRGIFMYRDIRDAIVSEYHHHMYMDPNSTIRPRLEKLTKEEAFMAENVMQWCGAAKKFSNTEKWVDSGVLSAVKYEDMKELPVCTLRDALTDIGLRISYRLVEHITSLNSFEAKSGRRPGEELKEGVLRKGVIGDWKNHFTTRNTDSINAVFGAALLRLGYEL